VKKKENGKAIEGQSEVRKGKPISSGKRVRSCARWTWEENDEDTLQVWPEQTSGESVKIDKIRSRYDKGRFTCREENEAAREFA
jgi:hypothetical protein